MEAASARGKRFAGIYHIRYICMLFLLLLPISASADAGNIGAVYSLKSLEVLLAFILGGLVVLLYFRYIKFAQEPTPDEERLRTAMILASANTWFYYQNLVTKKEWFSHKLKQLLDIKKKNPTFECFGNILQEDSYDRLRQSIVDLKAGEESFQIELSTKSGQPLECYGTIKHDADQHHLVLWWQDNTTRDRKLHQLRVENERIKLELQHLSSSISALPIPIWSRDKELNIRFCNLAFVEAAEAKTDAGSHTANDLEIYAYGKQLAKRALETKETKTERRHIILKGERKLFDITEIPWEDGQSLSGFALDISELEKVQQELERTKSTQADLLESTTSAIAIYGPDKRLHYYNNAFVKLWKLEQEEPWLETKPGYSEILEKLRENRSLPEQANFPAFKSQSLKLFTDLIEPSEEFLYLPDNRTIRVLAIPHTLGGILFAYEDVTDRLALERSYNTLIAVQKETLDNLHEGVAVFGEDGRLKLANPVYRKMWNISKEIADSSPHISDLLNRSKQRFYFDDWAKFKQEFISDMNSREVLQKRIELQDGKVLEVIIVPLPNGQTLLNYIDVTDTTLVERSLREKNEALQEADHLKSEFLANISYELRSPLTSIRGFTEMLRQDYLGQLTKQQQSYIDNIYDASQHLMTLIDDILDIASIEAGYMQLEISKIDIAKMLNSVRSLISDKAREAGISVETSIAPRIGYMEADENRVRQILYNLLMNAITYNETGDKVVIGAESDVDNNGNEQIILWVQDNGIGISEEEQESVFNKFYRGVKASRRKPGTGLGLSMVKSLVELHHGSVHIESTPNVGTKVTCYLPRKQHSSELSHKSEATDNASKATDIEGRIAVSGKDNKDSIGNISQRHSNRNSNKILPKKSIKKTTSINSNSN